MAHRTRAAAPLVGLHQLFAVVAERGRVPPLEVVRVGQRIDPERLLGVRDIHHDGVRRASGGEQAERRIRSHVMAVARPGVQRFGRGIAGDGATSGASGAARIGGRAELRALRVDVQPGEDACARDHNGALRVIELHLDDIELIQRVRWIGRVSAVLAPGEFRFGPSIGLPRHVEVDDVGTLRAGHDRVRMRPFARLHVLHELGRLRVRHVVNAHAGKVVLGVLHTLIPAIVAIACPFGGDEQQIAHDRRVALRGRALHD